MSEKLNFPIEYHRCDVCVVGGGMAGLVAAVASARRGATTMLLHDRPVLGGNASSEIRMWICGAHGKNAKETGILEEIQLANLQRNPEGSFSVWDSVLWEFAFLTPNLSTLLNISVNDGSMEGNRLREVHGWQMTSQTWHYVEAKIFVDASGDSILAPISGAETRHGRESREEFEESIAPLAADAKTMGNTILLQLEETPRPCDFKPPAWAYQFDETTSLPSRIGTGIGQNFWWLELGGLQNTIEDAESIRNELVKTAWGVWDFMKNRGPQSEKLRNWRLRWLGALPGKRENRRYVGDHILTQNDIESEGRFDDVVAYGGWSMDDHHPGGLYYPGKPTIFHRAPSPYGIPLRSLYSRDVANLFCAGRNISATHAALSSTRVMATCAVIGQAVGTASAMCVTQGVEPRALAQGSLLQILQAQLMDDDCWLPWHARASIAPQLKGFRVDASDPGASVLFSGIEREVGDTPEHWESQAGASLILRWDEARTFSALRMVFDSDLNDSKRMPCRYDLQGAQMTLPKELVRDFKVEVLRNHNGEWETVAEITNNWRRLYVLPISGSIHGLRWTGLSSWGADTIRLASLDFCESFIPLSHDPQPGAHWNDVVAALNPQDLLTPDHGLEKIEGSSRVGA